jgi:acyl-CoA synthetase (AMP-forming)/AMP-acid ligase II
MRTPNIVADLRAAAEQFPERPALVYGRRTMTFAEFRAASSALASGLAGLKMRDKMVCILGPTSPELALSYYVAFQSGSIAVPLNYSFRHLELETTLASICPETIACRFCGPAVTRIAAHQRCHTASFCVRFERADAARLRAARTTVHCGAG